jgi:hypothetical protein
MAAAGLAVLSKIYDRYEVLEADSRPASAKP